MLECTLYFMYMELLIDWLRPPSIGPFNIFRGAWPLALSRFNGNIIIQYNELNYVTHLPPLVGVASYVTHAKYVSHAICNK